MNSGAGTVVCSEVIHPRVPPEGVVLLLVNHQLLDQLGLLHHVQVEACSRLARPGRGVVASVRGRLGSFRGITGRHALWILNCI